MRRSVALLAALLLVLAGCAVLPRSGPVNQVEPSPTQAGRIGLSAAPPREGASPHDIVAGFLVAARAGLDDDFTVARQFLTKDAGKAWQPLAAVLVYPDDQNVKISETASPSATSSTKKTDTEADQQVIAVSVGALASLDEAGVYTESATDSRVSRQFSLKRENGEWRIATLDDGVLLSQHIFTDQYVKAPLYFFNQGDTQLVPDVRWYPRRAVAASAMDGLLAGPSPWLQNAVFSEIPDGTELDSPVTVMDGVAQVNLSSDAVTGPVSKQRLMAAEIEETLTELPGVQNVTISAKGVPLDLQSVPDVSVYPYAAYPVTALRGGQPVSVTDSAATPLMRSLGGFAAGQVAVAYENPAETLAFTSTDGKSMALANVATGKVSRVLSGTSLVAPSFDLYGWAWTGEKTNNGQLEVANPNGHTTSVMAPWLEGATVHDVRVSRDGGRIAVVAETGGSYHVFVAAVERDDAGIPLSLDDPVRLGQRLSEIRSIAWMSGSDLLVLGRISSGADLGVYRLTVGGPMSLEASVGFDAVALAAGRDDQGIAVVDSAGTLRMRSGGGWQKLATGIQDATYPG